MSKLMTQANNNFCVLNAQSVCVFACINTVDYAQNPLTTAHTTLQTLRGGDKTLTGIGFQPTKRQRR